MGAALMLQFPDFQALSSYSFLIVFSPCGIECCDIGTKAADTGRKKVLVDESQGCQVLQVQ